MTASSENRICQAPNRGLILPPDYEQHWHDGARGVIYAFFMIYCFLGVSIIADMFMSAIEEITRRRKKVWVNGRLMTPKVWNDTVANLSLMALGSSAPEIFLSVIDLFRKEMYAGDLGPFTIVGSAAFNLLVIVAVCIMCIPSPETREVKGMPVFAVTAVFSLFAYIWLVIIVVVITPDVVDWWEALVTFLFLPLLIWISYLVDKGCSCTGDSSALEDNQRKPHSSVPHQRGSEQRRKSAAEAKHQLVASITRSKSPSKEKVTACFPARLSSYLPSPGIRLSANSTSSSINDASTQVQFLVDYQCVSSDLSVKPITVVRAGDLKCDVRIGYSIRLCRDRSRRPSLDEKPSRSYESESTVSRTTTVQESAIPAGEAVISGYVILRTGEMQSSIGVERPAPNSPNPDAPSTSQCEDFIVYLMAPECATSEDGIKSSVTLGPITSTYVRVVPAGSPGRIAFTSENPVKIPSTGEKQSVEVIAVRLDGCGEPASCRYHTESLSAVPDYHYVETEGDLRFEAGVTEASIVLEVLPKEKNRAPSDFIVVLMDAVGVGFDPRDNGGDESAILTVTVEPMSQDMSFMCWIDKLISIDSIRRGNAEMIEQFKGAFFVHGSWEEQKEATVQDWVFHIISLPWKLLFTLVPTTYYFGGWACFYASLGFIALLTGVIADLAELFGCVLGIPDLVTAITFVALGTSMPDLFASKTAATEDPTADASIVNVTGSNSVNVFLGLGLPWTIASFYWMIKGRTPLWEEKYLDKYPRLATPGNEAKFVVESGNLGFSVLTFAVCCLFAFALLVLRRRAIGAELGGPLRSKIATVIAFVSLWFGFVGLVSWQALADEADNSQKLSAILAVTAGEAAISLVPAVLLLLECRNNPPAQECTIDPGDDEGSKQAVPITKEVKHKNNGNEEHVQGQVSQTL